MSKKQLFQKKKIGAKQNVSIFQNHIEILQKTQFYSSKGQKEGCFGLILAKIGPCVVVTVRAVFLLWQGPFRSKMKSSKRVWFDTLAPTEVYF